MLNGIFSSLYEWSKVYEAEQEEESLEDFRGPVYEGGDFVDTVTANTMFRLEKITEDKKKQISKNRFLKIGAISVAGLVLLSNIK